MKKRIVTRPDFDGVVCAVLLKEALGKELPIAWAQPNEIQTGRFITGPDDIVANLPVRGGCALWFDHHITNKSSTPRQGLFRIAPSAARLVHEYFQSRIDRGFRELVGQADKIDAAMLTLDEIRHPEHYPHILLSMTINTDEDDHETYCDRLVELLGSRTIDDVLADPDVKRRCECVVSGNKAYKRHLDAHTRMEHDVSVTDFRGLDPVPNGNRFLVYSLFPQAVVNMKLFMEGSSTVVKLGHSIVNRNCRVNVGRLLANYGGGGHRGAGACRLEGAGAETAVRTILDVLVSNRD
jgi:hypothetical protein